MDAVIATVFAVLAGAATALSPCVLPVLPVALAAGSTGGRRRPLGVAVGLAGTFALAAVLLTRALDALGLPGDLARGFAIAVLAAFGVALVVPRLGAARRGAAEPAGAARSGERARRRLPLRPRARRVARPRLRALRGADPRRRGGARRARSRPSGCVLGFAYGVGAAIALLAVMLLGRSLTRRIGPHAGRLQQAFGVLMVAVAVLLAAGLDRDFQAAIADDLPPSLVNPAAQPGGDRRGAALARAGARRATPGPRDVARRDGDPLLRDGGTAPEFTGIARWLNTPAGQEPSLRGLRGRVVLVDFWTYTCINCLRTLSHLRAWDEPLPRRRACRSSASTRPSSRSSGASPTCATRSRTTGCATRSRSTTTTAPGTRGRTSTGRRST